MNDSRISASSRRGMTVSPDSDADVRQGPDRGKHKKAGPSPGARSQMMYRRGVVPRKGRTVPFDAGVRSGRRRAGARGTGAYAVAYDFGKKGVRCRYRETTPPASATARSPVSGPTRGAAPPPCVGRRAPTRRNAAAPGPADDPRSRRRTPIVLSGPPRRQSARARPSAFRSCGSRRGESLRLGLRLRLGFGPRVVDRQTLGDHEVLAVHVERDRPLGARADPLQDHRIRAQLRGLFPELEQEVRHRRAQRHLDLDGPDGLVARLRVVASLRIVELDLVRALLRGEAGCTGARRADQ